MSNQLFADTLPMTFTDDGKGRAFVLLHGGAGARSMAGLAKSLAADGRVVVPTHPGFDGTQRPEWFNRINDLTLAYLALIERLDLSEVTLVGNSMGGWIAAEMALRHSPHVKRIVLLNAVGIEGTIADPTKLAPPDRLALSFHDPKRFAIVPDGPEALQRMAKNQETLRVYAGAAMYDPQLQGRLQNIAVPALVIWGESDRIVDVEYGRQFAEAIPGARFERVKEAGHFPQIEKLQEVANLIAK